jgi:hypothetical protein
MTARIACALLYAIAALIVVAAFIADMDVTPPESPPAVSVTR